MCHVLIIEDEILVALDIQGLLLEQGATSFSFASTEAEAVEEAWAHAPAVITSDARLHEGTGPSAVHLIRSRLGLIPAMFISGTPDDCIPRHGGDTVFSKPFDRALVRETFGRMLAARSPEGIVPAYV